MTADEMQEKLHEYHSQPTVRELADAAGIESYDTALPHPWVEKVVGMLSYLFNDDFRGPVGHIVWCYDDYENGNASIYGYPVAVTKHGREIMGALAQHATKGRF